VFLEYYKTEIIPHIYANQLLRTNLRSLLRRFQTHSTHWHATNQRHSAATIRHSSAEISDGSMYRNIGMFIKYDIVLATKYGKIFLLQLRITILFKWLLKYW